MISTDILHLPDNPEILKKIISDQLLKNHGYESKLQLFQSKIQSCQLQIKLLEESNNYLKNKIWGRKTEKVLEHDSNQLCLFDEAEIFQ